MTDLAGGLCPESLTASGLVDNRASGALVPYDVPKSGLPDKREAGAVMNLGGGGTPAPTTTTHYHKRAWRTESAAYVTWDTTSATTPYPGGGTLSPTLGVVMYTWVTTP